MSEPGGWPKLLSGRPWFEGEERCPIPAYSEFMPPPRVGCSPLGEPDRTLFCDDDPDGWAISEIEEEYELRPGMDYAAQHILAHLENLGAGRPDPHIAGHGGLNLAENPCWPANLAEAAGRLDHERYVLLLPLALSRTQDDKGRVRWTLFGGSELGPEEAFWKSFDAETPHDQARAFIAHLLSAVYGETTDRGFRILPSGGQADLPAWTRDYLLDDSALPGDVRYLLTFRPFAQLPATVRERYLAGRLALLPFPGSLVFWSMPTYRRLAETLPLAMQIPVLRLVPSHNGWTGLRVAQSGWMHEPHPSVKPSQVNPQLIHDTYHRSHRWERLHRYEEALALNPEMEKVAKVLFSTDLKVMGLYGKPMARNCQLWTHTFDRLLDGPFATRAEIEKAAEAIASGGLWGYRFFFPPMRVGQRQVFWHRPLVAWRSERTGRAELLPDAPLGFLMASPADASESGTVELRPRLRRRAIELSALRDFEDAAHEHYAHQNALNILTLRDCWRLLDERALPRGFARHLLRVSKHETLDTWLAELPKQTRDATNGRSMASEIAKLLEPPAQVPAPVAALTYADTATRAFEEAWWNDIRTLAHGLYINKETADCVDDPATLSRLQHPQSDLDHLGDYLLHRQREVIAHAGMEGRAECGELPFHWRPEFDFPAFGGWRRNRDGHDHERNLLIVIPGRNRRQAVVMGDHYDTAYMEDVYGAGQGSGARLAAAGADDNHSATATLLQAAPIFLRLAREGRLERNVWLLHQTGEEFPADCLGARHFCQALVEKTLRLRRADGSNLDLSGTQVVGALVMDMIAHNREHDPDGFQISPGRSAQSLRLAQQAHLANEAWNAGAREWNRRPERQGRGRGLRSPDPARIPEIAAHLPVFGEVRTQDDPQSSLYNTDCQIFSDIGAPVVLFMEDYDINRRGYHDTHDTLENIDLDYGAAVAAIAIETIARLATIP